MILIFIISLFGIQDSYAQLSGTYTINPSGGGLPNFTSFDAAFDGLKTEGVSGPVVINIFPGTYEVHTIIPQITGASSVNTITFQSSTGDSTLVTLTYNYTSTSAENYMIKLDGADYIIFKSLTFNAYQGEADYGLIFYIAGGANNNKFLNNAFYGKTYNSSNCNLIYSSGTDDENNIFEKNIFSYGHVAIILTGVSYSNLIEGTIIRDNVFNEQNNTAISLKFHNAPVINNNKFDITGSGNTAIFLETVDRKFQIIGNEIKIDRTSGAINLNYCDGLMGTYGLIANNMITVQTDNYDYECNGIRIYSSSYIQIYHNSILITSGKNTVSNSLYQTGGSNIDIRNNILANYASGFAYYITDAVNISEYNNYYTNGNYLASWKNNKMEDLKALISANLMDGHSISVNPVYNSEDDLHTTNFRLENKGTNLTSIVPVDFDGEVRATLPDIGADEFITGSGEALSGEYFIGGSSPDFATITQAADELNKYGIVSSVIFNIRDDNSPYFEQISILPVSGASESNTVTFRPDPSNTEDVIISYNASDYNANYTLQLKSASFINVQDLYLMSENNSVGNVIHMNGLCHHNTISGCTLVCNSNSTNCNGIYSYESVLKNLIISGNNFENGSAGIYLNGAYDDIIQDIEISDNYFYENNNGIRISYSSNEIKILRNRITSETQGIEISYFYGSLAYKGLIANNFINLPENSYSTYGLSLNNVTYLQVYFNTVKIGEENTYDNSRVISIGTNSNTDIRNNIFCNLGPGYAYYKSASGSISQSDYNALFTAGNYIAYYDGNQPDLTDLQSISGKDSHSLDAYPAFISEDEVYINSPLLDDSGIQIVGLANDIDNETRNNPPDIGADEFTSSVTPIPGGTYTIGGTAPDYNTIEQAFVDLHSRGISGPVVFKIRKGEYNEYIGSIFEIPGCTESDSIVVRSESGNPEDVVIYYTLRTQNNNAIFDFRGADNFTLYGLTISTSGEYYASQIEISGSANNINIINNELITTVSYLYIISLNGLTDQLAIKDNLFSGGKGIMFNNTTKTLDTRIINNIITGSAGIIYNSGSEGTDTWIIGNKIIDSDEVAIQMNSQIKPRVIGNIIQAAGGHGIKMSNCINNLPFYGLIANNMINVRGTYYAYGISLESSNKRLYIYNNTVSLKTTDNYWGSYGIYINDYTSNLAELKLINNIISNSSGYSADWIIYTNDANDITESDYNNYFASPGNGFITWGGTTCSDLAALSAVNGMDAHSLSLDPLFYSEFDLHSAQAAFHKAGTPLAEVPFDIDSVPRDPTKPDIGAVEFTCGTPVFNVLVSPTCIGDSTTFIDKSTNITPGATYGWDFDGDFVPDEGFIFTKSNIAFKYYFNTADIHEVHFIVTQPGGCNDYTTINVSVNNSPELDIITKGAYCGEDDGEITVHVTEGNGPFKYFWSTGSTDSTINNLAIGTYTVAVTDALGCISNAEVKIENAIQVKVTQFKPSTCGSADGAAVAEVTGGIEPYIYVWSDGNTTVKNYSLSPGRHYVNVMDAEGCYSQGFVDIQNDGSGPQVSLNKIVPIKCYGERVGSIDINVSGGIQPYDIRWSNGQITEDISNLAAGIYDVVVTDNEGCIGAGSFEVSQPTFLQVSSIVENSTCSGSDGRAMAIVSGGTKPYVYNWSSGGIYQIEEGLSAGIFSVTVFDGNACKSVLPVVVNSIGGPVVTINSVTGTGCADTTNGAIDIGVSGGTPLYTFEWLPGGQTTPDISNLTPGTYEIRVTDQAGCVGVNSAVIEKAPPPANPICLVTVDTISGKNMIVWEKLNTTDVDYYVIYRETSKENEYQPIGTRSVDSLSVFIDPIADPMLCAWKYRLSVVDVCGNESALSDAHKTMHLTMNRGITEDAINLIWTHYEGFDVSTYEVYRYTPQTAWQNITDLSAERTSYTDMAPTLENLIYYIQTEHPDGCTATDYKAETLNSSRSNRQNNLKITESPVNYFGNLNLVIWPNPGSGIYNLSLENINSRNIMIKLYDNGGRLIYFNEYQGYNTSFETVIDLSNFVNGIYHIHLLTGNTEFHRVLIKE